jgi:HEAT repeat protein
MLDQAFDALRTCDWGDDLSPLNPIDEAIIATQNDTAGRRDLENRLIAVLTGDATRDGKDIACRKLRIVGTEASVAALAALLDDENHAHMARYALESMPNDAAGAALRDALPKLQGKLKVGAISSLGVRQDQQSVPAFVALVADNDALVATAAAHALAAIRTREAAQALAGAKPNPAAASAATDALLACAESMLAAGDKATALTIYQRVSKDDSPKYVKLAATRGMLACAGK